MVSKTASFPLLVHELVRTHHAGNLRAMAQKCGLPYMTLSRWEHGEAENPRMDRVVQLCNHYGLEVGDVLGLLARDAQTRLRGGRPAVAEIHRTPGPDPDPNSRRSRRRRLGRRALRSIALAFAAAGAFVASPARATPVEARALSVERTHARELLEKNASYRRTRRRGWWLVPDDRRRRRRRYDGRRPIGTRTTMDDPLAA